VLIDEGTASAAEILAGALQDNNRGKLVGTTTFGTGTVLRPYPLSDGSVVMLAVEEWLTPKGRQIWQIWHKGITPDVSVALPAHVLPMQPDEDSKPTEPEQVGEDTQLAKAVEMLAAKQR
jgi:carboxyl-terminal processing protease